MTKSLLIVGSGPAAAGAALAAVEQPGLRVTVIDIGGRLEHAKLRARDRLAQATPHQWSTDDLGEINVLPVDTADGLPEKRSYGSDYPFRNFGQLDGIAVADKVNGALVSGAYGGFSNVWGAQVMPSYGEAFRDWPIRSDEMYRHYIAVLRSIPYAAEPDDLADLFPLVGGNTPLPAVSERTAAVLQRFHEHRVMLKKRGVTLGRARLAMDAERCVLCGLCMTGCPYSLIYSASHTLDKLREEGRIRYLPGLLAVRVRQDGNRATVVAREVDQQRLQEFTADRLMLACGAIGTTRLVLGSLDVSSCEVDVAESAQFILPFVSRLPTSDPWESASFTLNQFNMAVDVSHDNYTLSLLHFYSYNAAFDRALPSFVRRARLRPLRVQLLRRLSVALGYLPSWASPALRLHLASDPDPAELPTITLSAARGMARENAALRSVIARAMMAAPALDLWPLVPALRLSSPGRSYHWGGTFPLGGSSSGRFSSDRLGRLAQWSRIHLVDGSVLPTIPAATFTLTIMANAHRIVETALRELS